jgi:hypothetical protein
VFGSGSDFKEERVLRCARYVKIPFDCYRFTALAKATFIEGFPLPFIDYLLNSGQTISINPRRDVPGKMAEKIIWRNPSRFLVRVLCCGIGSIASLAHWWSNAHTSSINAPRSRSTNTPANPNFALFCNHVLKLKLNPQALN